MSSLARDYPLAWRSYRRWRALLWGGFLGLVPAVVLVGVPASAALGTSVPFSVTAAIFMGCFAVAGLRLSFWRCPRCGKPFHRRDLYGNAFARKCLNCGLPRRE